MGYGGNKLRLHPLCLTDFVGHIIDGIYQLADLILCTVPLDLHTVTACGNALSCGSDFRYRRQNGLEIIPTAGVDHQKQNHTHQQHRQGKQENLPIHLPQAGHIAQNTDGLPVDIEQGAGNRHNALPCRRIFSRKHSDLAGFQRSGNIRGHRSLRRELRIGRGNDAIPRIDKLQLHHIFGVKGAGKLGAGLVVFVIVTAQIGLKKAGSGAGLGFHAGLHIGIVVGRHRC